MSGLTDTRSRSASGGGGGSTYVPPVYRPLRYQNMLAANAWTGDSATSAAALLDACSFHAPEVGADETAREAFAAANPSALDAVYFEFGGSSVSGTVNTCVSATAANTAGPGGTSFHALFAGATATYSGFSDLRAIDMGKAGWGAYVASVSIGRMNALGGTKPKAVFLDDVNVANHALPNGTGASAHPGVPDAYASSTTYAAAIRTQLLAAKAAFNTAGYTVIANIGGIPEWETFFPPADTLTDAVDLCHVEFAGMYANQGPVDQLGWPRLIAAGAKGNLILQTFGATRSRALFNDYWARICGAKYASFTDDNVYDGPIQDYSFFRNDYGPPVEAAVLSGPRASRQFADGTILHVHLQTFDAWATQADSSAKPFAAVNSAAVQSIPTATVTSLSYDTEEEDTDGMFTVGTSAFRLDVGTAGIYRVEGSVSLANNATGKRTLIIEVGGVQKAVVSRNANSTTTGDLVLNVAWTGRITPGSPSGEVKLRVTQDSGGALSTIASSARLSATYERA